MVMSSSFDQNTKEMPSQTEIAVEKSADEMCKSLNGPNFMKNVQIFHTFQENKGGDTDDKN